MKFLKFSEDDIETFNQGTTQNRLANAIDTILENLLPKLRDEAKSKGFFLTNNGDKRFKLEIPNASSELEKALQKLMRTFTLVKG